MYWPVAITAIAGLLATALAGFLGYIASVKTAERQIAAQKARDEVAAARDDAATTRDYARRADEHYRPHFDTVMAAARSADVACSRDSTDIGDVDALDQCIDHLECSPLTRPVAFAATELRNAGTAYVNQLGMQRLIQQQMPAQGSGSPLNENAGKRLVEHEENELQPARDRVFTAVHEARETVKAAVARLESLQDASA